MAKEITLNHITKIEGHAKLQLGIKNGKVKVCELSSVEGSRYFEGIVIGRKYFEANEITSRICGICSSAHVITSIQAIEDAIQFIPSQQTKQLRVLLTLAERIRSHATHLYFLALPDYLGYESALAMASKYKAELKLALGLMKAGNTIIKMLGSRDLHPVCAAVGGWLKLPTQDELYDIAKSLKKVLPDAEKTAKLFASLKCKDFSSSGDWYSLVDEEKYAVLDGRFASKDSSYERHAYREFIHESQDPRSTANFVVNSKKRYMVGALSRLNNNWNQLSSRAKKAVKQSGFVLPSKNPFHNNLAQAIELVHCIEHAAEICSSLKVQAEPYQLPLPRAGTGISAIEVPRGTLWHEYTLDTEGIITQANIITPTAQNLLNIQEDIREFVPTVVDADKETIVLEIEKLIRSYDPCFSCSSHFLEVDWV